VASVRSYEKPPPCPTESMPVGSKMDPPLAKAEPISDSGSTCAITHLRRKKKKTLHNGILQQERRVGICQKNNSADTTVSEGGGRGGAPSTRAEIPLQPMEKTTVSPCSPRRSMVEQVSTCSPCWTPGQSRWMPEEGCDPVGSLH